MTLNELQTLTEAMAICNRLADRREADPQQTSAAVIAIADLLHCRVPEPEPAREAVEA